MVMIKEAGKIVVLGVIAFVDQINGYGKVDNRRSTSYLVILCEDLELNESQTTVMTKTEFKKRLVTLAIEQLENEFGVEFTGDDEGGRLGFHSSRIQG
jgi:hypothetical protein